MRTLASDITLERGKWYALRPDIENYPWVFFTPRRTMLLNDILSNMYRMLNETMYRPVVVFKKAFSAEGTIRCVSNQCYAPLPDGATIKASYAIGSRSVLENKTDAVYYVERI